MTLRTPRTDARTAGIGPHPPFDPELGAALAPIAHLVTAPPTLERLPAMRQPNPLYPSPGDDELRRGGAFTVEERSVPGPVGQPEISLLICRPASAAGPTGAVYHVHGGGMIVGNNRSGILQSLDWAQEFGLAVVSVEYRLAPETPHPGPVEDCYAGLVWTAEHAGELGVDRDRILIAGGSAGGGLAAATALLTRDRGGPPLFAQVLMYPMLDDRNDSISAAQMADVALWNQASNHFGWSALLGGEPGGPDVSPYAAPARASDLSGLPPTFLDVGTVETFRDEVVDYAGRIWAAGGVAELHVWPGGFHAFDGFAPNAQLSREARAARVAFLRRHLGP